MADNTKFVSLPPKQLTEPLSSSGVTLYANNLDFDADGDRPMTMTDLGDYGWIMIEPRSKENRELCRVSAISGTQLTIARGFKPFSPYDQDTATWAKTHSAGVDFVFTNAPQMYNEFAVKDNDETITGTWTFDEDTRPLLDADQDTAVNAELVTFGQLYRTTLNSAVDADDTHAGLVENATTAEGTNGTSAGSEALLFMTPAQIAAQIQSNSWLYGIEDGSGSDDAYTWTTTPVTTTYTTGMLRLVKFTVANTGSCTGNENGIGAKTFKKYVAGSLTDLETGDIVAGMSAFIYYDGTYLVLLNPSATMPTTAQLSDVSAFFATTKVQNNKVTMTAGHALSAGELVAVESDGKVYRTRPTSLPGTNSNTATSAGEQFGQTGRKEMYLTPTSTKVVWLGDDEQAGIHHGAFVITSDALYGSPSSAAWTSISSANATFTDSLLISDMVISAYRLATGATCLRATADIDGTPANGAELTVAATGGDSVGVATTSTANTYVAISNNGSNLVGYKITASGSTLTNAANAVLVSGSGPQCVVAKQFSGTDYILAVYVESSNIKAVVGEYNPSTGAWTSVGTPITIEASGGSTSSAYYLNPISSTAMFLGYQGSSDIKGVVITRSSTTTITAPTPTSLITSVTVPGMASFSKINNRSYLFGAETNAGGKLQIVALDRDYTTPSAVGSPATFGSTTDRGVAGCSITPTRLVVVYQSATTDSIYAIQDLGTNLDGMLGFIEANVATDGTEEVITSDYVSGLSGLTAGTLYFPDINGGLTTSEVGTLPLSASTLSPRPKVVPVLKAISSTTGIKV